MIEVPAPAAMGARSRNGAKFPGMVSSAKATLTGVIGSIMGSLKKRHE